MARWIWSRPALQWSVAILAASTAIAHPARAATPELFAERWIDGTNGVEPATQVQALDDDTFVIRQSVKTNFEAPFVYLLFGRDKALLIDTGAEDGNIRQTVDRLISDWLVRKKRADIRLIVAHSHSHGDHIAGDDAFRQRANTTLVGLKPDEVASFFGIAKWPEQISRYELGRRKLHILPTPGHQSAAIMVYDPKLRILLSGDTLYPGRLYVPVNFVADNRASVNRLSMFAARYPIRAVLGAHIEMSREKGRDYAHEAAAHPDEHPLELPVATIAELKAGMRASLDTPDERQVHDDFIIVPVGARTE